MKTLSKCCNSTILNVPKYQSYDMESNPIIKICSKCKKELNGNP